VATVACNWKISSLELNSLFRSNKFSSSSCLIFAAAYDNRVLSLFAEGKIEDLHPFAWKGRDSWHKHLMVVVGME
jgi:hypothetical protein